MELHKIKCDYDDKLLKRLVNKVFILCKTIKLKWKKKFKPKKCILDSKVCLAKDGIRL